MTTTTITVSAKQYEDHDDCLAAAAQEVATALRLPAGYDLAPEWTDEERDTITMTVDARRVDAKALANIGAEVVGVDDETTLTDAKATCEERIAAAARLCRAADDEQSVEGDSDMDWRASAEQAGTIDTMRQACDGEKPSREDWQVFGRYY